MGLPVVVVITELRRIDQLVIPGTWLAGPIIPPVAVTKVTKVVIINIIVERTVVSHGNSYRSEKRVAIMTVIILCHVSPSFTKYQVHCTVRNAVPWHLAGSPGPPVKVVAAEVIILKWGVTLSPVGGDKLYNTKCILWMLWKTEVDFWETSAAAFFFFSLGKASDILRHFDV